MDFKQIEAFITVAKLKSFSKAANSIYISQPTISSHILSLEKDLNVQLFDRSSKEVNLTPAGRIFLNYASDIINTKNAALQVLGAFEGSIGGKLTIAASTTPCNALLPCLIKKFMDMYPEVSYEIKEQSSGETLKDILALDCEIGFVGRASEDPKIISIPIVEDELLVISHRDMNLPDSITLDALLDFNLIVRDDDSATRKTFDDILTENGYLPTRQKILCKTNNLDTLIQCVKAKLGVSVVSKAIAMDYIDSQLLKKSSFKDVSIKRRIYIIKNSKRTLSPTATAFFNFCLEELVSCE